LFKGTIKVQHQSDRPKFSIQEITNNGASTSGQIIIRLGSLHHHYFRNTTQEGGYILGRIELAPLQPGQSHKYVYETASTQWKDNGYYLLALTDNNTWDKMDDWKRMILL
jgi:hypothetical protein